MVAGAPSAQSLLKIAKFSHSFSAHNLPSVLAHQDKCINMLETGFVSQYRIHLTLAWCFEIYILLMYSVQLYILIKLKLYVEEWS